MITVYEEKLRDMGASEAIINFVNKNFIPAQYLASNKDRINFIKKLVSDYLGFEYSLNEEITKSDKRLVFDFFEIDLDTREGGVREARQISMFFCKKYTKASLELIGIMHGKKDHATVMHARKTINNLYTSDKVLRSKIDNLDIIISKAINELEVLIKSEIEKIYQ